MWRPIYQPINLTPTCDPRQTISVQVSEALCLFWNFFLYRGNNFVMTLNKDYLEVNLQHMWLDQKNIESHVILNCDVKVGFYSVCSCLWYGLV